MTSTFDRPAFNRRALFGVGLLALVSPKKTLDKGLGLKRDLPPFKDGDVLSARHMNEIVERVNER